MTAEQNREFMQQYCNEVMNKGNTDALDAMVAEDYVEHSPLPGQAEGLVGLKQRIAIIRDGFPDCHYTIEQVVAEDDKLAVRWTMQGTHRGMIMGIPPTGKPVQMTGMDFYHLANGKLTEHWDQVDMLGLLQQLGVIPSQQ